MDGLTFSGWHNNTYSIRKKAEMTIFFLDFIFHRTWDHLGALKWTSQMDFYLRSGIQRLQWGKTLSQNYSVMSLIFMAWWQHLLSSPLVGKKHLWKQAEFKTKQDGSQKYIGTETKQPTMRAMRAHRARTAVLVPWRAVGVYSRWCVSSMFFWFFFTFLLFLLFILLTCTLFFWPRRPWS